MTFLKHSILVLASFYLIYLAVNVFNAGRLTTPEFLLRGGYLPQVIIQERDPALFWTALGILMAVPVGYLISIINHK